MADLNCSNIQALIEHWYEQELKGVQFPVDFDIAWQITGYSRKDSAKRKLPKRLQDKVFHISMENSGGEGGRPKEIITLSCDGLKHLGLMANTEIGDAIRQYFIEAEKKWKLVEQRHPQLAEDIEILRMKEQQSILNKQIELAQLESQKSQTELALVNFRYTITQTCPEYIQDKILGCQTVEKVEYRDRIIKNDEVINDGSTVNKTYLCKRLGLIKKGKPDYKALQTYLDRMPSDAFQLSATIQEYQTFKREYLDDLIELVENNRQLFIGE
jgi:hypothetical protein